MTQQPQLRRQDCVALLCHDLSQFCNKCLATWWHEDKVLLGSTPWFYLSMLRKPKHLLDSLQTDNRKKIFLLHIIFWYQHLPALQHEGLHRSHLSQGCHYPFSNSTEINVRWKEKLKVAFTVENWEIVLILGICKQSSSSLLKALVLHGNRHSWNLIPHSFWLIQLLACCLILKNIGNG